MRHFVIAATLSLLALAALTGAPQSSKKAAAKVSAPAAVTFGNADAISEEELKIYLYFLASDQLEGRNLPSRGYDTAALFVASHLAEWGLKPGGSMEKTDGPLQPYLMPLELMSRSVVPEDSKAAVALVQEQLGGKVIGMEIAADAKCEVCGNQIDDPDIARLGWGRLQKVLCVSDYKDLIKK